LAQNRSAVEPLSRRISMSDSAGNFRLSQWLRLCASHSVSFLPSAQLLALFRCMNLYTGERKTYMASLPGQARDAGCKRSVLIAIRR
ncbi:hypothetical protein, partial [Mesorhizobium sp. M8A.F.Ca.ET.218.01.1.1]|uniref:hypothetical protein n=1 Tax=Mesorhizobium sp. M8A.F.Ca.ET.218.01.1.1 TaxID=2563971 RepID=UPI001AEE1D51